MSKQVYKITEAVSGELATPAGLVSFSIAAGEHEPTEADHEIFQHLVAAGRAVPVTAKPAKKEA